MRGSMRVRAMATMLLVTGVAGAQSLTEYSAAAAGGAVGGAAGKKVSDSLTTIFDKLDEHTKAAAKTDAAKTDAAKRVPPPPPAVESPATAGPAPSASVSIPAAPAPAPAPSAPAPARAAKAPVARVARTTKPPVELPPNVPDPPPVKHLAVSKAPEGPAEKATVIEPVVVAPAPPPPPQMTPQELTQLARGSVREEVLKLGAPAERITMISDDGHLLEIYSYAAKGVTFGVLQLRDGAVSQVELR